MNSKRSHQMYAVSLCRFDLSCRFFPFRKMDTPQTSQVILGFTFTGGGGGITTAVSGCSPPSSVSVNIY